MENPKVFIVVLNYNGKDILPECLASLYKLDYDNFEVVIVDNNSTDGSFEDAKIKFGKFHFIKNSSNLGFAGGNNVAIKWSLEKMADYVWLLNNDTTVEENSLTDLMKSATSQEAKEYGVFSPIIYDENNEIWFSGGKINWFKMRTEHGGNIKYKIESRKTGSRIAKNSNPPKSEAERISNFPPRRIVNRDDKRNLQLKNPQPITYNLQSTRYITGCAMLIKKEVFTKIGLLDDNFFLYYEDADFSWRASQAGFKLGIVMTSKIFHKEKSSENSEKLYWLILSGILFFKKNTPWFWKPWISFYLFLRKIKNKNNLKKNPNDFKNLSVQRAYRDSKQGYRNS